jgi:hypothetical protein
MAENLEVNKENAVKAFNEADEKTKALLSNLFGEKTFVTDTTKLVKTFADACEYLDIDADEFELENGDLPADEYAYKQLKIIVQALNGGEVLDYKNTSVTKYYPYFYAAGSGSGFSFRDCACDRTGSFVGSRLVFSSRSLAEFAGQTFLAEYRGFMVIEK